MVVPVHVSAILSLSVPHALLVSVADALVCGTANVVTTPAELQYRNGLVIVAGTSVIGGINQTAFFYAYNTSNNYAYVCRCFPLVN
jgi:hypothetical protein